MFGMPDKSKIQKARWDFEARLAQIAKEAEKVAPPGSDTLKLLDRRISSLEQLVRDVCDAF